MNCTAFIGQSMHGAITAMASGKPALIVYPPESDQKFRELVDMVGIPELRATEWDSALTQFSQTLSHAPEIARFARKAAGGAAYSTRQLVGG